MTVSSASKRITASQPYYYRSDFTYFDSLGTYSDTSIFPRLDETHIGFRLAERCT